MADMQLAGGWSGLVPLTEHDEYVFGEAFGGPVGIYSKPHWVSRQVVNGMNYAFFCGANSATDPPQTGFVIAEAHESTGGSVSRTNITTYGMIPQQSVRAFRTEQPAEEAQGHWSDARPLDDHDTAVFEKTARGLTGVAHTPHLVSHQFTDGKNYRYFCTSKSLTLPNATGISIVTVNETAPESGGNVRITNISTFSSLTRHG